MKKLCEIMKEYDSMTFQEREEMSERIHRHDLKIAGAISLIGTIAVLCYMYNDIKEKHHLKIQNNAIIQYDDTHKANNLYHNPLSNRR